MVEVWLFECSQPDFATFSYGRLGILPEIELLASGECIFDLLGHLDELNRYSAMWLSWVFVSGNKAGWSEQIWGKIRSKWASKLACQTRTLEIWQGRHSYKVKLPIPIDYKIYFRVSAGTRSTVLGGDSVWVPSLVIRHSYDILGARMLWKPKEARILKNFIDQPM